MAGRKRESAKILQMKGKSHKTKAELDARENQRVVVGGTEFMEPTYVQADAVAHKKWLWIVDLYRSTPELENHITVAMTDQIASYCILYSEEVRLTRLRRRTCKDDRGQLTRDLLRVAVERNKIGKDLLLDFFSQAKIVAQKKAPPADPLAEMGFGNV